MIVKKGLRTFCSVGAGTLLVLMLASDVLAQRGMSRLEGTVKDSSGAFVAGASVIAKNEETGVAHEAFTNEAGLYVFPAIPPGYYTVATELKGFKRVAVEHLKLDIAATHVQHFTLEIGELTETVAVTAAGAAPIQTTTSEIGGTVQGATIQQLPLNGRNPLELIALEAGIAGTQAMSQRGSDADNGNNQAGLGANGARAVNNAVFLDGVDITNSENGTGQGIQTGTNISQSVDAIGEFRVISANPTAEFGKSSGMQIEIVTRSGTNEPHGSLYEFHRNTALNASEFFNNSLGVAKPKLIRNQFGGTFGGPVYIPKLYNGKNKTFFFVNYEGFRERQGAIQEQVVMTQEARNGLFRYNTKGPNSTALVDPTTGQVRPQYAAQIGTMDVPTLDKTRWDGIGKDQSGIIDAYLKATPMPNFYGSPGGGRDGLNYASYRFNAPQPDDRSNVVAKVDHVIGTRHNLSVRYSHGQLTRLNALEPFPGLGGQSREEAQRGVSINLISNLTSTVTNEFRFGLSRNVRQVTSVIQPGNMLIDCGSTFDCTGTTNPYLTNEPSLTARQTVQFTDNVSWAKGRHLFKGGFTVRTTPLNTIAWSNQLNMDFNSEPRNEQNAVVDLPQLFGGAVPIDAADRIPAANFFNFTLGRIGGSYVIVNAADPNQWGVAGSVRERGFRQREWGLFFQDDWRMSQKLTLNLGLRYELYEVPYEVNSFFTAPLNRKLLDPQNNPGKEYPPVTFGAIGPKNGIAIYPGDHNNFAPVIGFSYDPTGKGKTAIRAAYRVSYDKLFTATIDEIDRNAPGLRYTSAMNGETIKNAGIYKRLAPGGLNAGLPMTPRLTDLKGTFLGGTQLNGPFDLLHYLTTPVTGGGNLPAAPLGLISETRNSDSPYEFQSDLRTAYGQSWSLSIQHEIMRGTVIEVRYLGRKGIKEYMGLPSNEVRMPPAILSEVQKLQYLLTGGTLGIAPASLPSGFTKGKALTIAQLFGTTPNNATNYSQFVKGQYDAYAFQNFPNLYPFFLAGTGGFDSTLSGSIARNDFVSSCATLDNTTSIHENPFILSVPATAVPSGKGLNPIPPDRLPAVNSRGYFGAMPIIVGIQQNSFRPNLQWINGPRVTMNAGWSNYHALQFQIQRRFYQGLQFQGNFTWAKNLDVTSASNPTGQDASAYFCRACDYSYSDNDLRRDFKANTIWDVPIGKNRKWLKTMNPVLDKIIGGWQMAGNLEYASSFPINVAMNGNDRTAPPSTGGIRPDWAEGYVHNADNSQIGGLQRTSDGIYWFRASDFNGVLQRTLIGKLGNVPRNYWRGPTYFNADMTFVKSFPIREQKVLDFRAEFFNVLNHTHFAEPDLNSPRGNYVDLINLTSTDAGKIIDTIGNPRLVQFALKFRF